MLYSHAQDTNQKINAWQQKTPGYSEASAKKQIAVMDGFITVTDIKKGPKFVVYTGTNKIK